MQVSVMDISVMYVSTAKDSLDAPLIAIVHSCNIFCLSKSNNQRSSNFFNATLSSRTLAVAGT